MKRQDLIDAPELNGRTGGRLIRSFRNHRYLWYAFLLPSVLMWLAYLTRGIYPIANRCILTIDLYHQYAPFMAELYEKLAGFDSLLYSWNAGLGTNFLALSAYYLISPFNLLLLLFPRANLPEAITFIQIVKIGLCSFTMAYYLRKRFGRDGIGLTLFGALFALSAYILAYSWNVMWLDGVLMLPIIALGLEEMIAGRRFARYTVALALTIIFCYYISFFISLFLIIYFFVAYFSRYPALQFGLLFRKGLKFAVFSLLAGGMSAIIILPTYAALQLTSAADDVFPSVWRLSFTMFDFLTNHLLIVEQHIRDGLPNIYSGLAVLLLIPLYYFSRTISTRSKIAHIFGLLALYFSFNLNGLDFIWNGLHYPNQLPYRYAFVYVFLILTMAYSAFIRMREYPPRLLAGLAMAGAGFVLLAEKLEADVADPLTVYSSIVFLAMIAAAFVFVRDGRKSRELRITILTSVLIAEMVLNTFVTVDLMDRTEYYSSREGFAEDRVRIVELMNKVEQDGSGDFYRVELLQPRTVNDAILHSYRGVSIFASTAYWKTTKVMDGLGYHNNGINSYRFNDNTPVAASMLGIRYLVSKDASYSRSYLEADRTDGELSVYRNPYALPIGFMAGDRLDQWEVNRSNPFDVQNRFIELTSGVREVLEPLETSVESQSGITLDASFDGSSYSFSGASSSSTAVFSVNVQNTGESYFFLDASQLESTEIVIGEGEEAIRRNENLRRPFVVDLGEIPAGTPVQIHVRFKDVSSGRFLLYAASLNSQRYEEAMTTLAGQGWHVDTFNDRSLAGTVDVQTAGTLFTSIPYDKGWTVRVNQEIVETRAIADGLLGIDLEEGSHRVEMSYLPSQFREGAILTISSIVLFGIIFAIWWLINRHRLPDPPLFDPLSPIDEDIGFVDATYDAGDSVESENADTRSPTARSATPYRRQEDTHIRPVHIPMEGNTWGIGGGLPPQLPRNPADARFMPPENVSVKEDEEEEAAAEDGGVGQNQSADHSDQYEEQERPEKDEEGKPDHP